MKKIFTLCLSMMMGCMVASAQAPADEVFQFTDSKGTVIKDGSNITSKEVHVIDWGMGDEYLEYQVGSGVYLSNTSDALAGLVLSGEVKSATNGTVQLCFPMNCVNLNPGPFTSDFDAIYPTKDNESLKDIQLHLAVSDKDAEAKAEIELQVIRYDVAFNSYGMPEKGENSYPGSKITVNLVYDGTAGINDVTVAGDSKEVARYTLDGRKLSAPQKGINIVKYADGRTVKVVED